MSGFFADRRATATIEFALILPVLAALFFGGFAISRGFYAMQKVDFIAHNLADLAARTIDCGGNSARACLTASDVSDIFDAAGVLLSPLPSKDLKLTLSEVGVLRGDKNRKVETKWSITRNGVLRPCDKTPELPAGFTAATAPLGAIIIVDVSYNFSPASGFDAYNWTFARSHYAVSRNLVPADADSNLPNGHISNESGEGKVCNESPS